MRGDLSTDKRVRSREKLKTLGNVKEDKNRVIHNAKPSNYKHSFSSCSFLCTTRECHKHRF